MAYLLLFCETVLLLAVTVCVFIGILCLMG